MMNKSAGCEVTNSEPLGRALPAHGQHRDSVVAELVDYFNDVLTSSGHWTEDNVFSSRGARLQVLGNTVEAEVGPLRLQTRTRLLLNPRVPDRGHDVLASLRVSTRSGRDVAPDTPLRLQASVEALWTMDRLCRILHMLNYLAQGREQNLLWLHLSLGHALSIPGAHGQFFEETLRRCGLGPEQIVLLVSPLPPAHRDLPRLVRTVANYRTRGYRLALDVPRQWPESGWRAIPTLDADWLRLRAAQVSDAVLAVSPGAVAVRNASPSVVDTLMARGAEIRVECEVERGN